MLKNFLLLMIFSLFFTGISHSSNAPDEVAHIVAMTERPSGIVFEIVSSDAESLQWAIPRVKEYINKIRKKFPGLEMAVVTHGNEQFALQENNKGKYQEVHSLVESLDMDDKVPVHVCGTYASWRGITPEDFPAYVDVAPAGPAQINNYRELDYILVTLESP